MAREFQPYVGIGPFEREDQTLFFGRNRETSELLSLVIAHDLVLVYAESGAGKTSLINAGLVPRLEKEGVEVLPLGRVGGLIPEDIRTKQIPNLYVFNTLMSWAKDDADLKRLLDMTLADFLKQRKHPISKEGLRSPRVVIFDQFEELFAFYPEHRKEFFKQVADALEEDPLLRVVFVIREDYVAQLDPYAPLLPGKLQTRFRLENLRKDAALLAVKGPLGKTDRSFGDGVAEELVEDLLKIRVESVTGEVVEVTGEFVEPLQLQVVCQNLWRNLPPDVTVITQDHLQAFGDVNQALSGFYEEVIKAGAEKAGVKEKDLRTWFESNLITPGGTRGMVYRGGKETSGIPNTAVDKLAERHLIKAEWRAGARWYELIHDRLIKPIQDSNDRWRVSKRRKWQRIIVLASVVTVIAIGFPSFSLYQVKQVKQAESLAEDAVSFETTGQYPRALEAYKQALAIYGRTRVWWGEEKTLNTIVEAYHKRGGLVARSGDYDQAIEDYDQAIKLNPEYKRVYVDKAQALRKLGRDDEALAVLNQLISIDPKYVWAYTERGLVYFDRGDYDQAIEDYDQAIKLNPEYKRVYVDKAQALRKLGRDDEALAVLNWAYVDKAQALRKLGYYDEALAVLNQVIRSDPKYVSAYTERGLVYFDRGDYNQAIGDYDQAIKLNPEYKPVYKMKAQALSKLIEENPKDASGHYLSLGWQHYSQDRYDESIQASQKAISLDPEEPIAHFNLGLVYLANGKSELSREAYQKGIEKTNVLSAGKVRSTYEKAINDLEQLIAKRPDVEVEAKDMIQLLYEAKEEKLGL